MLGIVDPTKTISKECLHVLDIVSSNQIRLIKKGKGRVTVYKKGEGGQQPSSSIGSSGICIKSDDIIDLHEGDQIMIYNPKQQYCFKVVVSEVEEEEEDEDDVESPAGTNIVLRPTQQKKIHHHHHHNNLFPFGIQNGIQSTYR